MNAANQLTADANFAYQYDDNGNLTRKTLLATGNSTRYTYDAYGNILESLGAMAQSYTYTGRQLDQETGLYYYRMRYCDATTERFLQKDLTRCVHNVNLRAYAMNNPADLADALGLRRSQSGIDGVMKWVSISPFPDPHNGLQDAYRRGFESCVQSRAHSEFETRVLGWGTRLG